MFWLELLVIALVSSITRRLERIEPLIATNKVTIEIQHGGGGTDQPEEKPTPKGNVVAFRKQA